jgi:hypothetical protein
VAIRAGGPIVNYDQEDCPGSRGLKMNGVENSLSNRTGGPGPHGGSDPTFWLRYYAPSFDKHAEGEIRRLLAEIDQAQRLRNEVVELRVVPSKLTGDAFPDPAHEEEIYKRHFLPRKNVLKARTGVSLRDQLRSNSGRYNLAGTLAIVSHSGIEWLCPPYGRTAEFGFNGDARLDFLLAMRERGIELLVQLCSPVTKGQPEADLVDLFLSHRVLDGAVQREVPIGNHRFSTEFGTFDWRKAIDLVIETRDDMWVIEAKPRLNCEALGQVLLYGDLYGAEHSKKPVKLGIVCGQLEAEVLGACQKRGVTVFHTAGDVVRVFRSQ